MPVYLTGQIPNTYIWNGNGFAPLERGVNHTYPNYVGSWGPELAFGYHQARRSGNPVYIIKYAKGQTGLVNTNASGETWNPAESGNLYEQFCNAIASARNILSAQNKQPVFKGFLWVQGENDANSNVAAATYQSTFTTFFDGVKAACGVSSLPLADVLVREAAYGSKAAIINTAKRNIVAAQSSAVAIPSETFADIGDGVHYNGEAQQSLGRQFSDFVSGVSDTRPASVPAPLSMFIPAFAKNRVESGLHTITQLKDSSGNARHMSNSDLPSTLKVISGAWGQGFDALRFDTGRYMAGAANPLTTNSPYTVIALMGRFLNYNDTAGNKMVYSFGGGSTPLFLVSTNGRMQMRHNVSTGVVGSAAVGTPVGLGDWTSATETKLNIISYRQGATNTWRINGGEANSSSNNVTPATGGNALINDYNGSVRTTRADIGALIIYDRALTLAEEQAVEGWLYHLLGGFTLPADHPYYSTPPA